MKVHRRVLRLDGRPHTVITLRPGTRARFSTNYHHECWHVLSDQHGAAVLSRLLWGLAFQRHPGTLVVIDRPSLDPNPFDAEPANPIVLVNARLTPFTGAVARSLRKQLPLTSRSDGTVRWYTPGLDLAVSTARARTDAIRRREYHGDQEPWRPWPRDGVARVDRISGLLALIAPPDSLRDWAVATARLGESWYFGMDYTELDATGTGSCRRDGEVQIFRDYHRRVSSARVARREILATLAEDLPPTELNQRIWGHGTEVRARHVSS